MTLALAIPLSHDADLERDIQDTLTRMWTAKARKDYAEAGRLWLEAKRLHGMRSAERVEAMEIERGLR